MHRQLELAFANTWGGWRKGAGRKRGSRMSHHARPDFGARYPVHVTVKLRSGLPSMRKRPASKKVEAILREANAAGVLRIVGHSIQHDHLQLLIECDGKQALGQGMKSLNTKLARRLHRHWVETGSLLKDRYHCHVLETPTEARNAVRYVLKNGQHHGVWSAGHDPLSSAASFDGWNDAPFEPGRRHRRRARERLYRNAVETLTSRTWLLETGWRHGAGPLEA